MNGVSLSDEQLVTLIQSGKREYIEVLRNRYYKMIEKTAEIGKFACSVSDLSDAGYSAFIKAILSYSPDSKASFKTFAYACVRKSVISKLRDETNTKKRIPAFEVFSIDDVELVDRNDPESLVIQKEDLNRILEDIKSKLSTMEYEVFCEYIQGKSYKEIADCTGKSLKSVSGAITRAKAKIKR